MPVFTDKLGEGKFSQVAINFLNEMPFLVDPQRTWLMQNVFSFNLYRPISSAENEKLKNYLQIIASHQAEFKETLNDNDDLSSADNPATVQAISQNNQQMIDQFIASADGQLMGDDKTARRILDQFLNHFMLKNKICTVTTNLAAPNIFFAGTLD